MASSHDYKIAAEPDIKTSANKYIGIYFIVLAIGLFLTIIGLTIMFRFVVDYEKAEKIGAVEVRSVKDYKAKTKAYLSGDVGVVDNGRHVAIDEAKKRFLKDIRKNSN